MPTETENGLGPKTKDEVPCVTNHPWRARRRMLGCHRGLRFMQRIKSGGIDGVFEHVRMVSGLFLRARPTKMGRQRMGQAGLP